MVKITTKSGLTIDTEIAKRQGKFKGMSDNQISNWIAAQDKAAEMNARDKAIVEQRALEAKRKMKNAHRPR